MADVIRFTINFKTAIKSGKGVTFKGGTDNAVKEGFNGVQNYIFNDITFKGAKSQQRNIQNQLETKFHGIALKELAAMGRKIATQAIGLGPGARSPTGGSLNIEGPISPILQRADPTRVQAMSIKAVTGQWRARTNEYLQRKAKKFGHRKWWLNTGELREALKNPQMYISAYGPIRVSWIPATIQSKQVIGGATRFSNFAHGVGRTYTIQTGQVRMTVLGRITQQMLNDPGQRSYDSRFTGLFDMLPENVEKKLASRGDPFRSLIEPFLTFYLNRQIPNRIWGELERSIKPL